VEQVDAFGITSPEPIKAVVVSSAGILQLFRGSHIFEQRHPGGILINLVAFAARVLL